MTNEEKIKILQEEVNHLYEIIDELLDPETCRKVKEARLQFERGEFLPL